MVGENSGEWRVAGEQWPVNAKKSQHLFTAHTSRVPVSVPFTLCHRASGPFRASLRAAEPMDPRGRGENDGAVSEQSQLCGRLSMSD